MNLIKIKSTLKKLKKRINALTIDYYLLNSVPNHSDYFKDRKGEIEKEKAKLFSKFIS